MPHSITNPAAILLLFNQFVNAVSHLRNLQTHPFKRYHQKKGKMHLSGTWDPFDVLVRAAVGLQVSIKYARTIIERTVEKTEVVAGKFAQQDLDLFIWALTGKTESGPLQFRLEKRLKVGRPGVHKPQYPSGTCFDCPAF